MRPRYLIGWVSVAALLLAVAYRPAGGEPPAPAATPQVGRYQLHLIDGGSVRYVIDTATGEVWSHGGTSWSSLGKPTPGSK